MAGICCAVTLLQLGCRGHAHREVYNAKMANEIRVLEDQLYDADYENRVLREKLHRAQTKMAPPASYGPPVSSAPSSPSRLTPTPSRERVPADDDEDDDEDDFDMEIDLGDPVTGDQMLPPPLTDDADSDDATGRNEPEPPGPLPEPPGAGDVEVPPIVPGDILPPPGPGEENPPPPGKINLPDPTGILPEPLQFPEELKLNAGLSGGHQFDDDEETDGLYLVVNVLDDHGRMIDLNDFDIDGVMTIVALDPELDPSQARIGHWEYSASQWSQFIRSRPVAGLHVPVQWQVARPLGDEVIVHVRLKTDDEEMRCQGRLKVAPAETVADWTPRGGKQDR